MSGDQILPFKMCHSYNRDNKWIQLSDPQRFVHFANAKIDSSVYLNLKLLHIIECHWMMRRNNIFRISGGSEAQESLQKFTDFLETEASRGRISRALEKKILGKSKYIKSLSNINYIMYII